MPRVIMELTMDGEKKRVVDTGSGVVREVLSMDALGGERWLPDPRPGPIDVVTRTRDQLIALPPMPGYAKDAPPMRGTNWLDEELQVALILYHSYKSGHAACLARAGDLALEAVAAFLGRSVDSIQLRLANFGHHDPEEARARRRHLDNKWGKACPRAILAMAGEEEEVRMLELWKEHAADKFAFEARLARLVETLLGGCGRTKPRNLPEAVRQARHRRLGGS